MRIQHPVRTLLVGVGCTSVLLLNACGDSSATADRSAVDHGIGTSGFPMDILVRADLQRLVDAGLDRRTDPLIDALDDPDPAMRATAAHALASVQDAAARPHLIALLKDTDATVRRNTAFALGLIAGAGDASALVAALRDETDQAVRFAIYEAIGRAGNDADLQHLIEWGTVAKEDGPALTIALYHFARRGMGDPRAGPTLLAQLRSSDAATRMRAAVALAAPRDRASLGVTPGDLRDALNAMPLDRPEAAPLLRTLAVHADESDLPLLHRWLASDTHWTTRVAAVAALGGYSGASDTTIDALLNALDDSSPHVAGVAATALVELKARNVGTRAGLDPELWARWIHARLERPTVAAALLPGLVGSPQESLVLDWAMGHLGAAVPRALAWPALARITTPLPDSILMAALDGTRRDAYVAAAGLAQRLAQSPADAPLRGAIAPIVARRLAVWGPHAPASDVRGVLRLAQTLMESSPVQSRELIAVAARHPHPDIRAAALRAGATATIVPDAPRRQVNWSLLESVGRRPCLGFTTARGSFVVQLHPEAAPLAVSSLIEWAVAGDFDALTFHRVEPDFIIQSGDFDNRSGHGGPEHGLRSELSQLRFEPGVLGMASSGKDTEGSQFFITHNHAPSLDGRYGAVGRVIAGSDVADDIALGDALITVIPYWRGTDTCTSDHNLTPAQQ